MILEEWYFTLEEGRAKGPQNHGEIKDAILLGKLSPFDLIYKEGAEKWQPIYQRQEFGDLFKSKIKASFLDSWVVLTKRSGEKGVAYIQKGPFSTDQIKHLLAQGDIQYRDFIWQEGREKWSRISTLEIFNPPPIGFKTPELPQDVQVEEVSGEEALSQVLRQEMKPQPVAEEPPPEVDAIDLTQAPVEAPQILRKVPRTPRQPTTTKALRGTLQVSSRRRTVKAKLPWNLRIKLLPVAILIFVLGTAGGLWHQRIEILTAVGMERFLPAEADSTKAKAKAEISKSKKTMDAPTESSGEKVAAAPIPPPEPPKPEPPKIAPTRFSMKFEGGADPSIEFSTDASHHYSILLKVIGEAGKVLDAVSVYREVRVRRSPDSKFKLSLARLSLGEGPYYAEGKIEDFTDQIRFRLGRNDAAFRAKMDRHRKLISLPFQRERRRLMRATADLAKLTEDINSRRFKGNASDQIRAFIGEHFKGINIERPKTLVQPALWVQINDVLKDLRQMASGGMGLKESAAVRSRARDLVTAAQGLSLF